MDITALIMAGGKGSRMGLPVEKPMLTFMGKPLIDSLQPQSAKQRTSENST
jgi:GTP:adenosylcobinamide-phosphate guanylyltransferase